jgi:hypothetical protein
VVEVDRPNRQSRREFGKLDPIDVEAAARATLSGAANVTPKRRDGTVEQARVSWPRSARTGQTPRRLRSPASAACNAFECTRPSSEHSLGSSRVLVHGCGVWLNANRVAGLWCEIRIRM